MVYHGTQETELRVFLRQVPACLGGGMTLTPTEPYITCSRLQGHRALGCHYWGQLIGWRIIGGQVIEMDVKGEMERDLGRFPGRKRVS